MIGLIKVTTAAVAMSVQDLGRLGHGAAGHSRSGAMDPVSLSVANSLAGALPGSAAIEFGPGPCSFEFGDETTVALGGARRDGSPWWETIHVAPGTSIELSTATDGVWSYLAVAGGIEAERFLGSRSTNVREGIGAWIRAGDTFGSAGDHAEPVAANPPRMQGPVRIFGSLPGSWRVGSAVDRMGYQLDGEPMRPGKAQEWSEPVLPGCVQLLPSGYPIVLMPEASNAGGYEVIAVVHSEDLRLVAQTPLGSTLELVLDPSFDPG